jgi:hypothetical protein
LTHDEARTEFTLWAITRSPLILGANLTRLDDFTRSLITNQDVLRMNQRASSTHPIISLPPELRKVRAWIAKADSDASRYLALFNLDDKPIHIHLNLSDLSAELTGTQLRDLWEQKDLPASPDLDVTLAPHASVLYLAK